MKKKSNTINENPTPAEYELYSAKCQRISADNEKKKTVGKTMDHEKKVTHQIKVLPEKNNFKIMNDGEETDRNNNELFKKKNNLMQTQE